MMQFVSIKGGVAPVGFEQVILDGFAADGGLYVPTSLPQIPLSQLVTWKNKNYIEVAFEVLSLFIDRTVITGTELQQLLSESFNSFYHPDLIPIINLKSKPNLYIQELFHGPTLSFKDVAMGFIINLINFFLKKRNAKMTVVVATTGDTGPAAAHATIGKNNLNTWVLYPKEQITEEQARQMTTITASNVHAVGVRDCPDGADDLDILIAELFANKTIKESLNLTSVNSINWGRVMMQTVHYFFGYLQLVDKVGEPINFAVPSGAFGNLCAGSLARAMGLPVGKFIIANNQNACLHRIFSKGIFLKKDIINCESSAIDILIPYNFWRHLYFAIGQKPEKIKAWQTIFEQTGRLVFDGKTVKMFSAGFLSGSVTNDQTLATMQSIFEKEGYLLDPHGAVAVTMAEQLRETIGNEAKTLCLATAHPCKFPESIKRALNISMDQLPIAAKHESIEAAKLYSERIYHCHYKNMRTAIVWSMQAGMKG